MGSTPANLNTPESRRASVRQEARTARGDSAPGPQLASVRMGTDSPSNRAGPQERTVTPAVTRRGLEQLVDGGGRLSGIGPADAVRLTGAEGCHPLPPVPADAIAPACPSGKAHLPRRLI